MMAKLQNVVDIISTHSPAMRVNQLYQWITSWESIYLNAGLHGAMHHVVRHVVLEVIGALDVVVPPEAPLLSCASEASPPEVPPQIPAQLPFHFRLDVAWREHGMHRGNLWAFQGTKISELGTFWNLVILVNLVNLVCFLSNPVLGESSFVAGWQRSQVKPGASSIDFPRCWLPDGILTISFGTGTWCHFNSDVVFNQTSRHSYHLFEVWIRTLSKQGVELSLEMMVIGKLFSGKS